MDIVTVEWWFRASGIDCAERVDVDRSKYRDDDDFDESMSGDVQEWISVHGFSSMDCDEWGWKLVE